MYYLGFIGFVTTTIGLSIGGLIALFLNRFQQSIATTYALCAGMIIGLVYFEIVPESIKLGGWILFITGFLTGIFLFLLSIKHLIGFLETLINKMKIYTFALVYFLCLAFPYIIFH